MKPEEDIGSLLKTKLQSVQKASKEPAWEKIQHSLEERRKKRRMAFYFKIGSAGLLILLGVFFMFTYVHIDTENATVSQEEGYSTSNSQKTIGIEKRTNVLETPKDIKIVSENKDVNNLEGNKAAHQEMPQEKYRKAISNAFDETLENNEAENKTNTQVETAAHTKKTPFTNAPLETNNEKTLDTIINRNDVPVTQTTQKVYYYYNSKNGQEMSSTNKKVIDSIVEVNQKKQDSLKANH